MTNILKGTKEGFKALFRELRGLDGNLAVDRRHRLLGNPIQVRYVVGARDRHPERHAEVINVLIRLLAQLINFPFYALQRNSL